MKRKKGYGKLILDGLLVLLFAFFLVQSTTYNVRARMIPIFVSVPVLILCIIQFTIDLVKLRRSGEGEDSESKKGKGKEKVTIRQELGALGWVASLVLTIWLFGYLVAIPVITFLFSRFYGKETWLFSLIMAAITFAVVYGVFVLGVRLWIYPGVIYETFIR